jgi:hypothetical protein
MTIYRVPAMIDKRAQSTQMTITRDGKPWSYTTGHWYDHDDPENPFNFSKFHKWVLTLTFGFISVLIGA